MKQEFLIIHTQWVRMNKKKGTGHLEFNESIEGCAVREVYEETGLSIKNCRFVTCTNDLFKDNNKHYVRLFVVCEYESGDPEIKEPDTR